MEISKSTNGDFGPWDEVFTGRYAALFVGGDPNTTCQQCCHQVKSIVVVHHGRCDDTACNLGMRGGLCAANTCSGVYVFPCKSESQGEGENLPRDVRQ